VVSQDQQIPNNWIRIHTIQYTVFIMDWTNNMHGEPRPTKEERILFLFWDFVLFCTVPVGPTGTVPGMVPVCVRVMFWVVWVRIITRQGAMERQERPYHDDSTASRLLSEVKHRRARLVLRWGTTLESRVLFFLLFLLLTFPLFTNSVNSAFQSMMLSHFFACKARVN
jgi:hypothetical protein